MKVVFFGTPEFALPSLTALVESDHEVALVVSRPDKPVGRKKILTAPPVIEEARRKAIAIEQPKTLKNQGFKDRLAEIDADVAVVVAYGRIIPAEVLEIPKLGMVNLHPSLLPRHRGPSPIQWALVCGDRITGVTTMLLDEGMDTGPIYLRERITIDDNETAEELSPRLAIQGAQLIVKTLDGLEAGALVARAQAPDGVSVTPMLTRKFGEIEWSKTARILVNRLRGFTPWPGLYTKFRGARLKIFGLEEITKTPSGNEEPGIVISTGSAGIMVRCGGRSAVHITDVQREGRRRMPADAFLIGERVSPGERFG